MDNFVTPMEEEAEVVTETLPLSQTGDVAIDTLKKCVWI